MDEITHIVVIRDTLVRLVLNRMAIPNGGLLSKIEYNVIRPVMDIHTKKILGCGTKRGGLYYVDDFSPDMTNNVTHPLTANKSKPGCSTVDWDIRLLVI
ncbi:unnamed protein product [Prunus armeniaca]